MGQQLDQKLDQQSQQMEQKMDQKLDQQSQQMAQKMDQQSQQMEQQSQKMDRLLQPPLLSQTPHTCAAERRKWAKVRKFEGYEGEKTLDSGAEGAEEARKRLPQVEPGH